MNALGLRSEYGYSVGSGEILEKKSILDAHGYTKINCVTRVRKSLPGKLMYWQSCWRPNGVRTAKTRLKYNFRRKARYLRSAPSLYVLWQLSLGLERWQGTRTSHSKRIIFQRQSNSAWSYGASWQALRVHRTWLMRFSASFRLQTTVSWPRSVGYLAPWRCKKCKPVTRHVSGALALESKPNPPCGIENHGERFPHFSSILNFLCFVFLPCLCIDPVPTSLASSSSMSCSVSVWWTLCDFSSREGTTRCGAPVCIGHVGAVATIAGSAPVGVAPPYPMFEGKSPGNLFVGSAGGNWCTSVDPT